MPASAGSKTQTIHYDTLPFVINGLRAGLGLHWKLCEVSLYGNPIRRNLELLQHDEKALRAGLKLTDDLDCLLSCGEERVAAVARLLLETAAMCGAQSSQLRGQLLHTREDCLQIPVVGKGAPLSKRLAAVLQSGLSDLRASPAFTLSDIQVQLLTPAGATTDSICSDDDRSAASALHTFFLLAAGSSTVACDDALDAQAHMLLAGPRQGETMLEPCSEPGSMLVALVRLLRERNPLHLFSMPDLPDPDSVTRSGNLSLDTYSCAALRQILRQCTSRGSARAESDQVLTQPISTDS